MQTFECHNFTLVAHNLGTLQGEFSNKKPDEVRSAKNRKADKKGFQTWLLPLEELNMPLTKRQVERAMETLDLPITSGAFSRLLREIHSRLQDEFERAAFYICPPWKRRYWTPRALFLDQTLPQNFPPQPKTYQRREVSRPR